MYIYYSKWIIDENLPFSELLVLATEKKREEKFCYIYNLDNMQHPLREKNVLKQTGSIILY